MVVFCLVSGVEFELSYTVFCPCFDHEVVLHAGPCAASLLHFPSLSSLPAVSPASSASDIPLTFVSASTTDHLTQVCQRVIARAFQPTQFDVMHCLNSAAASYCLECVATYCRRNACNSTAFTPSAPAPIPSGHHQVLQRPSSKPSLCAPSLMPAASCIASPPSPQDLKLPT